MFLMPKRKGRGCHETDAELKLEIVRKHMQQAFFLLGKEGGGTT